MPTLTTEEGTSVAVGGQSGGSGGSGGTQVTISAAELARLTGGATGGLVVSNITTNFAASPFGPQTVLGRTVRIAVPLAVAWASLRYIPSGDYAKGAAIGASMTLVNQLLGMATQALGFSTQPSGNGGGGGNGSNGGNGQQGLAQRPIPERGASGAGMSNEGMAASGGDGAATSSQPSVGLGNEGDSKTVLTEA